MVVVIVVVASVVALPAFSPFGERPRKNEKPIRLDAHSAARTRLMNGAATSTCSQTASHFDQVAGWITGRLSSWFVGRPHAASSGRVRCPNFAAQTLE